MTPRRLCRLLLPPALAALLCAGQAVSAAAQTCRLDFTVRVTQGVGPIQTGATLDGQATYTALGRSFRQEGGSTAHLATGEMVLGDGISGPIWTLIITSRGPAADLVGVYAHNIEGLSVAGQHFTGPMAITLFGRPGSRPDPGLPTTQEEWDRLDLRRAFSLHAPQGRDMLAGDVTSLRVACR
jgi:hypothetical protein